MLDKITLQDQRMLELIAAGKLRLPDNEQLANIYRRRGDLARAATEYDRLYARGIDGPGAARMRAVFHQQAAAAAPPDKLFAPAPFVQFDQFLDPASNQSVLNDAIAKQALFRETEVYKSAQGRPAARTNLVTYEVGGGGDLLRAQVAQQLPLLCERLGKPFFDIKFIQLKIASYANGDYFKPHHDNGENNPERRISFVYYFHHTPKPYRGGDLLLYDTRFDPSAYVRSMFTRIVPQNNNIIFFPSEYFHEVTPVEITNDDFTSSRFTMAGHIG